MIPLECHRLALLASVASEGAGERNAAAERMDSAAGRRAALTQRDRHRATAKMFLNDALELAFKAGAESTK